MSTILITGTSRGIGNQLANYYLKLGNTVVGCSRGRCDIDNSHYHHFSVDIADWDAVINMFFEIKNKELSPDVLINNAGISSMNHILTTPIQSAVSVVQTNLLGTFAVTREAARMMSIRNYGRIVNFSTVAYPLNLEGEAIYSASKAGIVSLTRTLAYELAPFSITVNAIGPNPIKTDLIKGVPQEKIDALIKRQAIERYATIEDITNIIDFLIKPESNFITGQTIYLGGIS